MGKVENGESNPELRKSLTLRPGYGNRGYTPCAKFKKKYPENFGQNDSPSTALCTAILFSSRTGLNLTINANLTGFSCN